MTTITLIHTSQAHVQSFKALASRIAGDAEIVQIVREDWLTRARKHGLRQSLRKEIAETVEKAQGTVICTCTTIADAATEAGALRIDGPMMEKAAVIGGPILLVYALESTRDTSLETLDIALKKAGTPADVTLLDLSQFWPLFEAAEYEAFAACMAGGVRDALEQRPFGCVVLAQASMASATALLADIAPPVLSSPETALRAALAGQARSSFGESITT
ncbi:hypothetical protein [Shimia sp. SDUM112013]|uniref:hypothetical protein n=1 Tax=Shimia sp. SDUM112013 TaxID=3136160 RepID=UPI0032EBE5C0